MTKKLTGLYACINLAKKYLKNDINKAMKIFIQYQSLSIKKVL